MKHLLLLRLVLPKPNYILRRSFLFHSGKTTPSPLDPYDTLQRRVARSGDPSASIIKVLDGWLDQGNLVKTSELHSIIKMLRKFSRFSHALQVSHFWIPLLLTFKKSSSFLLLLLCDNTNPNLKNGIFSLLVVIVMMLDIRLDE